MSFDIVKTVDFPQAAFQYDQILGENAIEDFPILGGTLSDLKHVWHAKGPCLEVRNVTSGQLVGSWIFGRILKDSNTKIVAVDELKGPCRRLPLLAVAFECKISGGLISVFDILGSKVLRVVQIGEQITSIHVIDSGFENSVLPEPSPLRYFDGIVAVGTLGGNVYLLDICRQSCESGIHNVDITIRDELNPCPMVLLKKDKIGNIKKYVERSVDREEHLAIHANVVLNPSTEHFTLKGENGEDRVHVNSSEVEVSSLFYSAQLASLLVGYNFGAFQLWDLRSLDLVYTSPICEEHIPVMHFTVQEPADDPKAYCYIWVSYSHNLMFNPGLPFAVMYSFYYDNKNYVAGYGNLYEDFQHCSVRFQIELGDTDTPTYNSRLKGGICIGFQSINKYPINKDLHSLSLCLLSWLVWNAHKEVSTCILLFDLNQWYKEQMPRAPNWSHCSNYIIRNSLCNRGLDMKLDQKSISQFIGIQRLEEHFCPTALSFDLWCVAEHSILKLRNKGLQQAFLDKIVEDQHLSLVRPEDYFEQIPSLGLVPLFCEIPLSNSQDIDYQREVLLNVALEQELVKWLCICTSRLANNAFNSSGLTIHNILNWAFERAITLKNACDKYCVSLFDYSGTRLDNNTIVLIESSTEQIRNICHLYQYVASKLMHFVSDQKSLLEEQRSLKNVVEYFKVLLWMVNMGLLPECQINNYRRHDDSFTSTPYLVNDLTQYYNRKRTQMQMASHDTFVEKDCLLFIDNLINIRGCADILRQQWQEDGGSGLYPPPSLQSVLRTYFLDGPDLIFKHCLVTYTLLDVATTIDENNKIIKLLKFPQNSLSQSNIKIVQAYWHLDHDDFETALKYMLNPCVLTKDLQQWHHSIMVKSLLLQNQPSLALEYLARRKPSIQNEKDLLTVISLLISKNMLDEAFEFRQQHQNPNEQVLLLHIFNECNKNELLHSLLDRRLNNDEEQTFFKYLQSTKDPRCEDLKIFYYLLRSRFLEAFDSHSATKRMKPENQGLVGQRDATTVDNVVKMFKTLLPDVNQSLVDLVPKERTNPWKEVRKPTPLSVFVHNAPDQVKYKSSAIFSALSKAKQTFNDSSNDTRMNNETPVLRTPTAFRTVASVGTPLIKSKVIEQNDQGEDYGSSPCKKFRLSPRTSKMSSAKSRFLSQSTIQSKLHTPIIKRKRLSSAETGNSSTLLPQSILKASSVSRTILDDSISEENTSVNTSLQQLECEDSVRRPRLALTPRKPVNRTTPLKSHVKFDDLRYSNSSNEQNSKIESPLHHLIPETNRSQSVNSATSTVDENFYSLENSPSDSVNDKNTTEMAEQTIGQKSLSPVRGKLSFDETLVEDDVFMEHNPKKDTTATTIAVVDNDLSKNTLTFQSPKSRRSYKRSFGESIPVRYSPRLAQKAYQEDKEEPSSSESTINKSESLIKPSPSVAVEKLRGRKSLSRAVLENTVSKRIFEENKFSVMSCNDPESELWTEQGDDSIEEALAKYRSAALEGDSPFSANHSLTSDTDNIIGIFKQEEVVSNTMEVRSIESHSENARKRDTQESLSSENTINISESLIKPSPSIAVEKLRGRKSLSRAVLENNTVSKLPPGTIFDRNKSSIMSSNDSESNILTDQGDDSIEEVLAKYRSAALEGDSLISANHSLTSDTGNIINIFKEGEVVSKTMEVRSIETHSEIVRNRDTQELVSSRESINEYYSKKVEMLESDEPQELSDKDPLDLSFFDETTQEFDGNPGKDIPRTVEDDKKSDVSGSKVSESQNSLDQEDSGETQKQHEEVNVYEDLSSGSEDVRAVLRQFGNTDNEKVYTRNSFSTSVSYYQSEKKDELMPQHLMESANNNSDASKSPRPEHVYDNDINMEELYEDIPVTERAFIDSAEVIEIGSSSDEDDHKQDIKSETTSENSQSSSSSEEKSYSSRDESKNDMIVGFEKNLNEITAPTEKTYKIPSIDEETNGNKDNIQESSTAGSIRDTNEENRRPEPGSDEDSQQKPDGIQDGAREESSDFSLGWKKVANLEQQFESDQKEIAAAVKMIQADTLVEEQQGRETADDEHMDSLILEERSPEKEVQEHLEPKIVEFGDKNKDSDVAIIDAQKVTKVTKSLQCTLGANDSLIEPSIEDDNDISLKDDKSMQGDARSMQGDPMKLETGTENLVEKQTPVTTLKQSRSLQCTLGVNDSIMEDSVCVIQENDDSMVLNKDQVPSDIKSQTVDLGLNKAPLSPLKHSRSVQCTLGVNDSVMDSSVDDTSVFLKDNENMDLTRDPVASEHLTEKGTIASINKHSRSVQCSLDDGSSALDTSEEADISVPLMEEPEKMKEATPLVLRTVKKTYPGRKAEAEASVSTDADGTDSTQQSPQKERGSAKTSIPISNNKKTTNSAEVSEEPEPSLRVTRRRSILLSQLGGTPNSSSGKSVSSSSGDRTKLTEATDRSSDNPAESSASQPSTSQSTMSQSPGSQVIPVEVDVMETDEEMKGKEEGKLSSSKIRSRRSSNTSTDSSRKPHAISLVQLKKRTRSASVDQSTTNIRNISVRSKSIDIDDLTHDATKNKPALQVMLTAIDEQAGPSTSKNVPEEVPKHGSKAYSDVGAYTTSRRLTRRQATMLKTFGKMDDKIGKLPSVEEIDPVHLLNKSEFAGIPDPDETKVYEQTSPSNSSGTPSRRSTSIVSDVLSTPTKRTYKKSEHVKSPVSGIKSRLRKQSTDTMSVASEQSDSHSPAKRAKKTDSQSEIQNDTQSVKRSKRGKSRASSVSSTKSALSDMTESSVRTTRSRRIQSAKDELPEIQEEKGSDEVAFGSPAQGVLQRGDIITKVSNYDSRDIRHQDAQNLFKDAGGNIRVVVQRETLPRHNASTGSSRNSSHYSPLSVSPHLSPRGPPLSPGYSSAGSALTPVYSTPLTSLDNNYFDSYEYGSRRRADENGETHVTNQPYRTTPLVLPGAKVKREPGPTESYLRHHPNPSVRAPPHHLDPGYKVAHSVLERISTGDPNKQLVHKQFNSPINIYSEPNVVDTIHRQTGVHAAPKRSVKFNPAESETYKALQEEQQGGYGGHVQEVSVPPQSRIYTPTKKHANIVNQNPQYLTAIGNDPEVIQQSGSFRRLMMSVLPGSNF